MHVRIVSRKLIKPSVPTPNDRRILKLSFIDQLAPAAYGSFIFYYNPCINGNEIINNVHRRLELLEASLSETLTRFYPLAGRFIEATNAIDCKDQGAEFFIAQVDDKLHRFLERKPAEAAELNRFIPFADDPQSFSPTVLAVQLNVFGCGGLTVGVCLSHKMVDGFSLFTFIEQWASASRFGVQDSEVKIVNPSFELGSLLPARDTGEFNIPVPEENGLKMVTKRFVFDGASISTLKYKAAAIADVTRVQVVTAIIWKARIAVAEAQKGHRSRPSVLTMSYNFRGKTGLKLPEHSFGNAFKLVLARFEPNDEKNKLDFRDLATLLADSISRTTSECSKIKDADGLFASATSSIREIREVLTKKESGICVFTSVCRFPYYEVDFGWGKPSWVSSVHKHSDIVLMMDTKCGRGIEAWVTLEETDMLKFQQDEEIVAFTVSS